MIETWPSLPPVPTQLLPTGETQDWIFVDTNILLRAKFLKALRKVGRPVVSSVVFGELLARYPNLRWHETVVSLLGEAQVQVVPLAAEDAQCFWEVKERQGLRFDCGPLLRPGEDRRRCHDRLRFDLLILAVALRHRKPLVTDNKNDFVYFPFRELWRTREAFALEHGWAELA